MKPSPLAALVLLAACSPAGQSQGEPPQAAEAPAGPQLVFPVDCVLGQTCEIQNYVDRDPGPGAKDYRCEERTYQDHKGVDIRVPSMAAQRAGVYVLAAAPGVIARLRDGVADVSVRSADASPVDGMECGNGVVIDHGEGWETQYCHLARNSLLVRQGEQVQAGQAIARIGLSGNTEYPHLHFTVRRDGQVVDDTVLEDFDLDCALLRLDDGDDVAMPHRVPGPLQPFDQRTRFHVGAERRHPELAHPGCASARAACLIAFGCGRLASSRCLG